MPRFVTWTGLAHKVKERQQINGTSYPKGKCEKGDASDAADPVACCETLNTESADIGPHDTPRSGDEDISVLNEKADIGTYVVMPCTPPQSLFFPYIMGPIDLLHQSSPVRPAFYFPDVHFSLCDFQIGT
jgi:hypothetical protein